jgi:hypothetical protein
MDEQERREAFRRLVGTSLKSRGSGFPSLTELNDAIDKAIQAAPIFDIPVDIAWVAEQRDELRQTYIVTFDLGEVLTDDQCKPWLEAARASITPYYWDRYRKYLIDEKDWNPGVVDIMDKETERVLDLSGDPAAEGAWDRRGLVMGHVQSGKTANYIGLITKAADAGYKTIIVIAGIQNLLRNQTQGRIDEGFIGYDSVRFAEVDRAEEALIGAGRLDHERRPMTLTNRFKDFSKNAMLGTPLENQSEPVVFVVKKNSRVLKTLLSWLRHNGLTAGEEPDALD